MARLLRLAPAALLLSGLFTGWAGPLAKPVAAAGGDWPQFHNGPTHEGYNAAETILSPSNVADLGVAWTGIVGGPDSSTSSPAVADGVVYIGGGALYAFRVGCAAGGAPCAPLWEGNTWSGWGSSSPAVANGVVYVGSWDGKLYAFDAAGVTNCGVVSWPAGLDVCNPLWTGATGGAIWSSPTVADGVVYVVSNDGNLYAFAVGCASGGGTCTPLWTAVVGTPGQYAEGSPTVADGVVYVGSTDGSLHAFAVGCSGGGGTCTPLWTAPGGSLGISSPAVAGGVVYNVGSNGSLNAFAVGCASGGGTCTPLWTATVDIPGNHFYSSPAVANGVVYIGSTEGYLYAFAVGCASSGGTCTPLWTGTTGGWVKSSPAVADGVVYVGSYDGKLYAFAVGCASGGGTCTPLWTATTGGGIYASPAVANGVVYVGSDKMYAFGLLAGLLDHLVLSPSTATIAAAGSQPYTATGYDAHGNSMGDVTASTTFTISGTGLCSGASCSATVPGDYTVTGTDGVATGTASLHVSRTPQTIAFAALPDFTYGVGPFSLTATATSGLPVAYTASGSCAIGGAVVTITGAGSCTITASQPGDSNYAPATPVSQTFTVRQAPLTIKADNRAKAYGAALPPFTVTYSGFVNGDTPASLGGSLTFSTTATASSPVGAYPITPSGLTSSNYSMTFVPGTLSVVIVDRYSTPANVTLNVAAPGFLALTNIGTSTVVISRAPTGRLILGSAPGSFTYVPPAGWSGTASFAYQIKTGSMLSNPVTVTIYVLGTGRSCTGCNLSGLGLQGVNLSGSNLSSANLSGTRLDGGYLPGANLSGANLTSASLTSANLLFANLSGANLTSASLTSANLLFAKLSGANLAGANVSGAYLFGANLTNSTLAGANLSNAVLTIANLAGANLTGANLTGANLSGANLAGANLTGANLTGASLNGVTWSNAICPDGSNANKNGRTCAGHLTPMTASAIGVPAGIAYRFDSPAIEATALAL